MPGRRPILCLGAAHWDVIGRASPPLAPGVDLPGRVERRTGGVAANVALALAARGQAVALLSAIGRDGPGEQLIAELTARGVDCGHVARPSAATDSYVAIEDGSGELFAAVVDCATLDSVGDALLAPLRDGRLAAPGAPWRGAVVIDGHVPAAVLDSLTATDALAACELYIVPASPRKARHLSALLAHGTIFANVAEAAAICGRTLDGAEHAARALLARGARRALVTDGARPATFALAGPAGDTLVARPPPRVVPRSVTGAGDALVAAFVAAEQRGATDPLALLQAALAAAAAQIARAAS